jgi:hypothetical protein
MKLIVHTLLRLKVGKIKQTTSFTTPQANPENARLAHSKILDEQKTIKKQFKDLDTEEKSLKTQKLMFIKEKKKLF